MKLLKASLRKTFEAFGYEIIPLRSPGSAGAPRCLPGDFGEEERKTIEAVRPFTMTSPERLFALIHAVRYLARQRIPGNIVECGVWKGGSMMAIARTLKQLGDESRELYLYDTFDGMVEPTGRDRTYAGEDAGALMRKSRKEDQQSIWCYSPIEEVRENLLKTGYPRERVHFIKGPVEHTLPAQAPGRVALLRLDTDWYESTKHELVHLFPRLVRGGVLIIDDYGWWQGARQATDEYFAENNVRILLNRIDHTGRIAVKSEE
jgi:O-methyltransferase